MKNKAFGSWPQFSQDEANKVKEVLLSNKVNYWTGSECFEFEKEFSQYIGTKYAIALANGTLALELALRALNIGKGDEVLVTSRTFIASVSCIINSGAKPIFVDVDLDSQNICPKDIYKKLSSKTKAIICVHLAGWPCDMDPIMEIAKANSLFVIEDCAQAHGATYKGKKVGSIGDIGCWSFCQDKIMTTGGEGGMVTLDDKRLWSRMWSFKDHGKSWNAMFKKRDSKKFTWVHHSFGSNFRMIEMQAAIGRLQLKKLDSWVKERRRNAKAIWDAASMLPNVRIPKFSCENCNCKSTCEHAAYKCYIFIDGTKADRDKILNNINQRGVPCFTGSCSEVYLERAFINTSFKPEKRLVNAKKLGDTSLMFLCHPTLTNKEIEITCNVMSEVINSHFN